MSLQPEDLVGKFVAYDSGDGATFAKVESVWRRNYGGEEIVWVIVDDIRIRNGISITSHPRAMLRFDKLVDGNLKVIDVNNLEQIKDVDDQLFLELLGGNGEYKSAFSLGVDKLPVDKRLVKKFKSYRGYKLAEEKE